MKFKMLPLYRPTLLPLLLWLLVLGLGLPSTGRCQSAGDQATPKVTTVLLPLHLDSLFKGNSFKFGNAIPRFALPYLEFYNGVLLAVEELKAQGVPATVQVIDSRRGGSLATVLADYDSRRSNLLIGVAKDGAELRQMAEFAKKQNIPFVSATFPNDGGIKANPNLAIMNSTMKTHTSGIVRYLQHNHASERITIFTRKGTAETYLNQWLEEAAGQSPVPKPNWRTVTLTDTFEQRHLLPYLDSTRNNTLLVSSLDAGFGQHLMRHLSGLKGKYPITIIGMPTWDEIDLRKSEFKGLNVVYSTPFEAYSTNIDLYKELSKRYETMANSKPSDMALKGYEYTYRFVKQLAMLEEGKALFESGFTADPRAFTEINLKQVRDKGSELVNYFENQKLYFVRKTDGVVKGIY